MLPYDNEKTRFRFFRGLRPFDSKNLIRDGWAGIALAAVNIPQVLGYTKIAGTPVVTGFYSLLLPLVAFAVFGSSRYLVVAADSATAALLAGGLAGMASVGSDRYLALAGMVALLSGGFLLLARLFKLGFLADFLSRTVLLGFLAGVGIQLGIAVSGGLLGIEFSASGTSGTSGTIDRLLELIRGLPHVHGPTLAVTATVAAVVVLFDRFAPKVPGRLLAVIGAIAASAAWNFTGHGISIIGPVSGGLPHLGLPDVAWKDVTRLLPLAASCFAVIVAQSAATARVYAARHDDTLDENADLAGLSAANVAAALSGTFVVNGSPTQTALMEAAGGRSQVTHLSLALVVAVVLLFLTKPLQYLPLCVLSTLVFMIALRLIDWRALRDLRKESPGEFALAAATVIFVVLVGVEQGILLAVVFSLLRIVWHSYHPHTGVLGKDGSGAWVTLPAKPGTVTWPGLIVYRFSASIFYANAGLFSREARKLVGSAKEPVTWFIVDCEAIAQIDYSAAHVILRLKEDFAGKGIEFAFARVQPFLRGDLDRHHITRAVGAERVFARLHDALAACEESTTHG